MADKTATADPFEMWRDWVANSERQWNSFLNNAMATDEFSQAMGRMMDVYLNMQKNMNEVMGRYLQVINVPTRNDVMAIGERLSQIEGALARMSVPSASGTAAPRATAVPRPPRTKKPAKA